MFQNSKREVALIIYTKIVTQSRKPFFYKELKITDDFFGRLEVLSFNLILIMWSLKKKKNKVLSQELFNIFFEDLDNSLRELGVSDLSVGKKIKVLAQNFYGRLLVYTNLFEKFLNNKNITNLQNKIIKNFKILSQSKTINKKLNKYIGENVFYFNEIEIKSIKNAKFEFKII